MIQNNSKKGWCMKIKRNTTSYFMAHTRDRQSNSRVDNNLL